MGLVNVNALSGTSWTDTDNIISQLKGLAKRVELNDKTLTVYFDEVCFIYIKTCAVKIILT